MNAGGVASAGEVRANVAAGNTATFLISRLSPSWLSFIQLMNSAACCGCLRVGGHHLGLAAPGAHGLVAGGPGGEGGRRPLPPAVLGAIVGNWLGAHWADTQPTMFPLFMSVSHWVDQLGSGLITPLFTRPCQ